MARRKEPYVMGWREFAALVEAVLRSEAVKPVQQAKRDVFRKYGILGTRDDPPLTAVFYDIMLRLGILDRLIQRLTGVRSPYLLDARLRAALRVATHVLALAKDRVRVVPEVEARRRTSSWLSKRSHPFIGMWFFDAWDELKGMEYVPATEDEEFEYRYLLPAWYVRRMREILREEAEELFKALRRKLLISVRVNTLKASVEEVLEALRREGKEPVVSDVVPTVIRFEGPYNFDRSRIFREGKIVIQEESAALASIILDPRPGEFVVDLCAAPGGKTEHMGELMRNEGMIHAFDIDEARIRRMRELLRRTGVRIVRIHRADGRTAPRKLGKEVADKVLVDPPCTSDGTLPKNPDLRWRMYEAEVPKLAQLQYELLVAASKLVKPGGRILYTTCSLLPEEDEEVVSRFLKKNKSFRLIPIEGPYDPSPILTGTMRAWPHRHGTIGFFYALLERVK